MTSSFFRRPENRFERGALTTANLPAGNLNLNIARELLQVAIIQRNGPFIPPQGWSSDRKTAAWIQRVESPPEKVGQNSAQRKT